MDCFLISVGALATPSPRGHTTGGWLWTDGAGTTSEVLTSFGHNRQRAKTLLCPAGNAAQRGPRHSLVTGNNRATA